MKSNSLGAKDPTKKIKINTIVVDEDIQPRVTISDSVVSDYKEGLNMGDSFPPIVVFDDGKDRWLADGFHRHKAHVEATKKTIEAVVKKGTKRDAMWYAFGANSRHGNRLNNSDKRKIVARILLDSEWSLRSNVSIARYVGCSEGLVRTVLSENGIERVKEKTVERKGTSYTLNTEGSTKQDQKEEPTVTEEEDPKTLDEEESNITEEPEPKPEIPYQDKCRIYRGLSVLAECLEEVKTNPNLTACRESYDINSLSDYVVSQLSAYKSDIDIPVKQDTQKASSFFKDWIVLGRKKPTGKGSRQTGEQLSNDAVECIKLWEDLIGFPPTAKEGDKIKYAKELEKIVRIDGQDWGVVREVINGAKICWVDNGISIQSPLGIRKLVKSGACKKWESIWDTYRKHPQYKPLRPVPKCPVCGKGLRRGNMTKAGRKYSVYMCPDHPKESMSVGKNYMPEKVVRD